MAKRRNGLRGTKKIYLFQGGFNYITICVIIGEIYIGLNHPIQTTKNSEGHIASRHALTRIIYSLQWDGMIVH